MDWMLVIALGTSPIWVPGFLVHIRINGKSIAERMFGE